jgi:hypothetical protein
MEVSSGWVIRSQQVPPLEPVLQVDLIPLLGNGIQPATGVSAVKAEVS